MLVARRGSSSPNGSLSFSALRNSSSALASWPSSAACRPALLTSYHGSPCAQTGAATRHSRPMITPGQRGGWIAIAPPGPVSPKPWIRHQSSIELSTDWLTGGLPSLAPRDLPRRACRPRLIAATMSRRPGWAWGSSPDDRPPMNIANLFVRASRRRADGPAVALGTDVLLTHDALVQRAAAIAGALRQRFGLAPGDRAALVMSNVPDYLELLLAGWHAGLAMVPANARLHRRELAYILGHAGARVCFVTPDLAETVAPLEGELPSLERVVEVGSRDHLALRAGRADRACRGGPGRRRLAVLHQRHDRPAQGRHADPSQPSGDDLGLSRGCRRHRAERCDPPCRAACRTARGFMSCRMRRAAPARCCRPAAASIRPRFFAAAGAAAPGRGHHPVRRADHGPASRRAPRCRPLRRIPA